MLKKLPVLFLLTIPSFAELPYEVLQLKSKRDAKIAEINQAYSTALSRLMDRYAAAGETEKAAAVKALLDEPTSSSEQAVNEDPEEDARLKPLIGVWKRDTDNGIWTITDTKGGVFNGNLKFTMKFDPSKNHVIVIGTHWADRLDRVSPN